MVFEILCVAVLVASYLGTVTGFGLSTLLIPIVLLWFPVPEALLIVGIIHWFVDVRKIGLFVQRVQWKIIIFFGITGILFSYLGASLIYSFDENVLKRILGGILIAYALYVYLKPSFEISSENKFNLLLGGASSGFMAGLFGVGGAIRSAFLQAYKLTPAAYIATSGAIALIIDSTRLVTYIQAGTALPSIAWWQGVVIIALSFVGSYIAKRTVNNLSKDHFRMVVMVALLLLGGWYIIG